MSQSSLPSFSWIENEDIADCYQYGSIVLPDNSMMEENTDTTIMISDDDDENSFHQSACYFSPTDEDRPLPLSTAGTRRVQHHHHELRHNKHNDHYHHYIHNEIEFCFSSDSSEASSEDDEENLDFNNDDNESGIWRQLLGICGCRRWLLNRIPQPWLVSVALMTSNLTSGWMWMTFAPITSALASSSFWNVPTTKVNELAGAYMHMFMLTAILVSFVMMLFPGQSEKRVYRCFVVGVILQTIGATVRFFFAREYIYVYLGTMIAACAHTLLATTASTLLYSVWTQPSKLTADNINSSGLNRITIKNERLRPPTPAPRVPVMGFLASTMSSQLGAALAFGATILFGVFKDSALQDDNNSANQSSVLMLDVAKLQLQLGSQLALACISILIVSIVGSDYVESPKHQRNPALPCTSNRRPPLAPINRSSFSHRKTHSPTDVTCFDNTALFEAEEKKLMDPEDTRSFGDESSLLVGDASLILGYGADTVGSLDMHELENGSLVSEKKAVTTKKTDNFGSVREELFRTSFWRSHIIHLLVCGLPNGVLYTIPVFLNQILRLPGIPRNSAIWLHCVAGLGIAYQLSCVAGWRVVMRPSQSNSAIDNQQQRRSSQSSSSSTNLLSFLLAGATLSLLVLLAACTSAASPSSIDRTVTTGASSPVSSPEKGHEKQSSMFTIIVIMIAFMGSGFFLGAASSYSQESYGLMCPSPTSTSVTMMLHAMVKECWVRIVGFLLIAACGSIIQSAHHDASEKGADYTAGRPGNDGGDLYVLLLLNCAVAVSLVLVVLLEPQTTGTRTSPPLT